MCTVSPDEPVKHRRMKDYLKPEDLDTEGCVALASAVLEEQAAELAHAAKQAARHPNKENLRHLQTLKDFYKSDLFLALSCGIVDGEHVVKTIIGHALEGTRINGRRIM